MKILLIEDDKVLSNLTSEQLTQENYVVDKCYDGEEAVIYIEENIYDLIICDRMLPKKDGLTILRQVRGKGINTPVLLLTALDRVGDRVDGLDAGADDYLTKPFDIRELLARVRALTRRPSAIVNNDEYVFEDLVLNPSALTLKGNKSQCTLSKKEGAFLVALIKNNGKTLPRKILFGRVWGLGSFADDSSIDSYSYFIRRRLEAVSRNVTLVTVRGIGLRLEVKNNA